jgi:DNA-binding XRE family transcriptional regulator
MTIKRLRELSGMTQVQFAEYFNIPLETIKSWESETAKRRRTCNIYVIDLMEYKLMKEGLIAYAPEKMKGGAEHDN